MIKVCPLFQKSLGQLTSQLKEQGNVIVVRQYAFFSFAKRLY